LSDSTELLSEQSSQDVSYRSVASLHPSDLTIPITTGWPKKVSHYQIIKELS